jgi:catechol 2,3-dioxygenase-like lactoylglutathione lyase family enzyme
MKTFPGLALVLALSSCETTRGPDRPPTPDLERTASMDLGAFSVSLAVKDLAASRAFYEKLGFAAVAGEPEQRWLILQNSTATIGLFQGMFEKNMLTFNPGWASRGEHPKQFTDVREIQRRLRAAGLELQVAADESTTGPAHLMLVDPDGNPILLDQHVPAAGGRAPAR